MLFCVISDLAETTLTVIPRAWEYDGEVFTGVIAAQDDRRRRDHIARRCGWTVTGLGKNLVLGPSMALELGVGEVIGMTPAIRLRLW